MDAHRDGRYRTPDRAEYLPGRHICKSRSRYPCLAGAAQVVVRSLATDASVMRSRARRWRRLPHSNRCDLGGLHNSDLHRLALEVTTQQRRRHPAGGAATG
jgi:hypothetical protein